MSKKRVRTGTDPTDFNGPPPTPPPPPLCLIHQSKRTQTIMASKARIRMESDTLNSIGPPPTPPPPPLCLIHQSKRTQTIVASKARIRMESDITKCSPIRWSWHNKGKFVFGIFLVMMIVFTLSTLIYLQFFSEPNKPLMYQSEFRRSILEIKRRVDVGHGRRLENDVCNVGKEWTDQITLALKKFKIDSEYQSCKSEVYFFLVKYKDFTKKDLIGHAERALENGNVPYSKPIETHELGMISNFEKQQQQEQAAVKVQSLRRGVIERRNVAKQKQQQQQAAKQKAAITIQSLKRKVTTQRKYVQQKQAATKIQSHSRGIKERRKYVQQKQLIQQQQAATKIQSRRRGIIGQRKYAAKRKAAITNQSLWRGFIRQRKYVQQKQQMINIQSQVRGFIGRNKYAAAQEQAAAQAAAAQAAAAQAAAEAKAAQAAAAEEEEEEAAAQAQAEIKQPKPEPEASPPQPDSRKKVVTQKDESGAKRSEAARNSGAVLNAGYRRGIPATNETPQFEATVTEQLNDSSNSSLRQQPELNASTTSKRSEIKQPERDRFNRVSIQYSAEPAALEAEPEPELDARSDAASKSGAEASTVAPSPPRDSRKTPIEVGNNSNCQLCGGKFSTPFNYTVGRHHCRMCGLSVCSKCAVHDTSYIPEKVKTLFEDYEKEKQKFWNYVREQEFQLSDGGIVNIYTESSYGGWSGANPWICHKGSESRKSCLEFLREEFLKNKKK